VSTCLFEEKRIHHRRQHNPDLKLNILHVSMRFLTREYCIFGQKVGRIAAEEYVPVSIMKAGARTEKRVRAAINSTDR
jgi:hypothetical protein